VFLFFFSSNIPLESNTNLSLMKGTIVYGTHVNSRIRVIEGPIHILMHLQQIWSIQIFFFIWLFHTLKKNGKFCQKIAKLKKVSGKFWNGFSL